MTHYSGALEAWVRYVLLKEREGLPLSTIAAVSWPDLSTPMGLWGETLMSSVRDGCCGRGGGVDVSAHWVSAAAGPVASTGAFRTVWPLPVWSENGESQQSSCVKTKPLCLFLWLCAVSGACGGGGVSRHAHLRRSRQETEDGRCHLSDFLLLFWCHISRSHPAHSVEWTASDLFKVCLSPRAVLFSFRYSCSGVLVKLWLTAIPSYKKIMWREGLPINVNILLSEKRVLSRGLDLHLFNSST